MTAINERTISVVSPLTGESAGSVPVTEPSDVAAIVAKSRETFETWGMLSPQDRRPLIRSLTRTVVKNMERIADVIVSETGKDRGDAHAEVVLALTTMDYVARTMRKALRPIKGGSWPFLVTRGWTEYHPIGVAGVISPWNYPFYLPMLSVIQALAAGCSVVLKPSEVAPHSGGIIGDLAVEAGLPDGVVTVIHGYGDTGAALVESADVIAFTGSTEVGRLIAQEAVGTFKPLILELGGKDAMIVLEDASLKDAARTAASFGTFNAGQTCVGVERVYVVDEVYDEFVDHVMDAMRSLNAGQGDRGDIGPMIDRRQVSVIESHVADAIDKGATIALGGKRHETADAVYYEPTVVLDVNHTMDVMHEETFGPVVPIMRVPDEATALHLANDSKYGLHGSVWTKDKRRGERIASRMKTGTVAVNDHLINFFYPTIKLGGIGDSGLGGVMSGDGIRAFCVHRSITEARFRPTTMVLGGWLPRRVGPRWWKFLARALFGWRR
ncbi:MAG: aldehyde dehydrogenase family protein [Acidimicrobiia bacterium]|nr:aldehyde dehydrogenase family protein [Acidimicrobiia bacterium]